MNKTIVLFALLLISILPVSSLNHPISPTNSNILVYAQTPSNETVTNETLCTLSTIGD
jgi:hypothetical protein